jgi:hypothetical protein
MAAETKLRKRLRRLTNVILLIILAVVMMMGASGYGGWRCIPPTHAWVVQTTAGRRLPHRRRGEGIRPTTGGRNGHRHIGMGPLHLLCPARTTAGSWLWAARTPPSSSSTISSAAQSSSSSSSSSRLFSSSSSSSTTSLALLQREELATSSSSSVFLRGEYDDDPEVLNGDDDMDDNDDDRVLAYLRRGPPPNGTPDNDPQQRAAASSSSSSLLWLPKRLKRLVARASRQCSTRPFYLPGVPRDNDDEGEDDVGSGLVMDMVELIASQYRTRMVPLLFQNTTICSGPQPSDAEQLTVEILSLCVLYTLPYEITKVFLSGLIPLYQKIAALEAENESLQKIQRLVDQFTSWEDIRFPKGLAVQRIKKQDDTPSNAKWYRPRLFRRRRWTNAKHSQELIELAAQQASPPIVNRTELFLLRSLQYDQEMSRIAQSNKAAPTTTTMATKAATTPLFPPRRSNNSLGINLYFPTASRRRQLVERVRRYLQQLYDTAKAQGRAGFLAYCIFNFTLYTGGLLWQWHRVSTTIAITTIGTTGTTTAVAILARQILGVLFATSQLLKIPKLLFAVGFAPFLRHRVLSPMSRRFGWSDRTSTMTIIATLLIVFTVSTAIPMVHEYHQIRRQRLLFTTLLLQQKTAVAVSTTTTTMTQAATTALGSFPTLDTVQSV